MPAHYIHTIDGVMTALGKKKAGDLNYYFKNAREKGIQISKIQGGIEYFDLDLLRTAGSRSKAKNQAVELDYKELSVSSSEIKYFELEIVEENGKNIKKRKTEAKVSVAKLNKRNRNKKIQLVFLFN